MRLRTCNCPKELCRPVLTYQVIQQFELACKSIRLFWLLFHAHKNRKTGYSRRLRLGKSTHFPLQRYFDFKLQFYALYSCLTGTNLTATSDLQTTLIIWCRSWRCKKSGYATKRYIRNIRNIRKERQTEHKTSMKILSHSQSLTVVMLTLLWSNVGEFLRLLSEGKLPGLLSSCFLKSDANGGVDDRFGSIACETLGKW